MINKKALMPYFQNFIPGPVGPVDLDALPTAIPTPAPAAVASTPTPAPTPAPIVPQPESFKTGAKGKQIPIGKFGNRLDTAEGRAKEAKMQQDEQIAIASHALQVAESQRAHGHYDAAAQSAQLASQAANRASALNQGRAQPDFFKDVRGPQPTKKQIVTGTSSELERFRQNVTSFDPFLGKPQEKEEDDDDTEIVQPTVFRPSAPISAPSPPKPKIVKNPNRDVIDLSREQFALSSISRLVFEQVGSIELANISRRDTIEGQNSYYELISNLSSIRKNFDPTSIISRQKPNQNISSNYTIRLNEKVPDDQYLERNNLSDFYYIDSNGDLVIELDNLSADEIIDIEIATSGTISLVDEA